jgi:hypothetical protein
MVRRVDEVRRAEWQDRFCRFRSSGLSVQQFCAEEGVSVATFYVWRKRLPDAQSHACMNPAASFASVRLVGGGPLIAWLPGGTRLELPVHNPAAIELVLRVLIRVDGEQPKTIIAPTPSC